MSSPPVGSASAGGACHPVSRSIRSAAGSTSIDHGENRRVCPQEAMDEADELEQQAMAARARATDAQARAEMTAAEMLDEQRAAEAPPSIPAPMRRNAAGVPELDQSPATPEQVAAHERRTKRER